MARRWRDDDHEGADGTGATGRASRAPASAAGAETTAEGNYAPSGNGSDDSGQLVNDDEPANDSQPRRSRGQQGVSAANWLTLCQRHDETRGQATGAAIMRRSGDERDKRAPPAKVIGPGASEPVW